LRSSPARLGRARLPDFDPARVETVGRGAVFVAIAVLARGGAGGTPRALAVGAVAVLGVWLVAYRDRPQRVFNVALVALLLGDALFGRGLAHVRGPPGH